MTRSDLKRIIAQEGLVDANFLDEGPLRENAVVLQRRESDWAVYLTIDRAFVMTKTFRAFHAEEEALDYMLLKLRQSAHARRLMAQDD